MVTAWSSIQPRSIEREEPVVARRGGVVGVELKFARSAVAGRSWSCRIVLLYAGVSWYHIANQSVPVSVPARVVDVGLPCSRSTGTRCGLPLAPMMLATRPGCWPLNCWKSGWALPAGVLSNALKSRSDQGQDQRIRVGGRVRARVARLDLAGAGAAVARDRVAVVALLARGHVDRQQEAVAARGRAARRRPRADRLLATERRAAVAHVVVAVVALLATLRSSPLPQARRARTGMPHRRAEPALRLGRTRQRQRALGLQPSPARRVAVVALLGPDHDAVAAPRGTARARRRCRSTRPRPCTYASSRRRTWCCRRRTARRPLTIAVAALDGRDAGLARRRADEVRLDDAQRRCSRRRRRCCRRRTARRGDVQLAVAADGDPVARAGRTRGSRSRARPCRSEQPSPRRRCCRRRSTRPRS